MSKELEIWYVIPSANPPRAAQCLQLWKSKGYKVACALDAGMPPVLADRLSFVNPYPGYFSTVNQMAKNVLETTDADIIITGGDDMYPDQRFTAAEIGVNFTDHFPDLYGVMQPTGDKAIDGVDRICGSPWVGRTYCEEAYGGNGPFWPGYFAFFGDEEMKVVAEVEGVLWQREDLVQIHNHWARPGGPQKTQYQVGNDRFWERDKAMFAERKANNFPGTARVRKTEGAPSEL
jgi:hypothetical protein